MLSGIFAGVAWALATVILGTALASAPFIQTEAAIVLAPFVSTFLHDLFSGLYMFLYNAVRGKLPALFAIIKQKSVLWLVAASAIGGPVGMTGYVMAVSYMGSSVGAVASAVYPAIGTLLAFFLLKERVMPYQFIFLCLALLGVYGLSYSPSVNIESFWLGLVGAFMCAFGWGIEAVILAKCLKNPNIKNEYALGIRQIVSSTIYGAVLLPLLNGWSLTISLFTGGNTQTVLTVCLASLFATVSYLFYYLAISRLGASKAMALNITYTAWSILFAVIIIKDYSVLNPLTLVCAGVVVICGILAATDFKSLFTKGK